MKACVMGTVRGVCTVFTLWKGGFLSLRSARGFQVGDLVLRRAYALKPVGKLDPIWEGPYKVTGIIGKGAYELEDPKGRPLPRPWNVHNLKKYFT
ncbi:UNVERIFIED_CONTAM: hypothetical protein Sradi_7224000 [Sesamum radiatum]|uniref:Uncharacterized protein n=1 Tax=Sesamum radiatum TaxID=300843 RepID=A0AAW2IN61_SESRA